MTRIVEYKPVMTRPQRLAFWVMVPLLALLGANSIYLAAIPEHMQNQFYLWNILLHLVLGLVLVVPFALFIVMHVRAAWGRENKKAIKAGLVLLSATLIVLGTGVVMMSRMKAARSSSAVSDIIYWAHVLLPLLGLGMYVVHRRAGPRVHWNWGFAWATCVAAFVGGMALLHNQDPRKWYQVGSPEGEKYFEPSSTRTASGKFIPEEALMMDHYCIKCHEDAYKGWFHSAHHFSSFNNPAYRFSVRETRKVSAQHDPDGIPRGARWCAGCHDQVPFLSGKFDDPNYDDVNDPTAHAGITCTVCHAVTNLNSTRGNGDYTIDEPVHYPFAYSTNPVLQWINERLVKAKPAFHKKTFLKPFHRTTEFCSACHKVSLPFEVNHYKEFLRGQNHHDPFWLSGVSGYGARSFYYPPKARTNCADCHMPLQESDNFASRDFDGSGKTKIHSHLFPSANTAVAAMRGDEATIKAHADYLRGADPKVIGPSLRVDIFGLKEGASIEGPVREIRPELPALRPGGTYLLEVVLRTLNVGHLFTQGTVDSNEVWVEIAATSDGREIGRNGAIGPDGQVDPWAHFVNVHMLDRHGNRIDRRNAQDIFTPLYNKQIPPGAGQVAHYRLDVPADVAAPVEIVARVHYRKFDRTYMDYVFGEGRGPVLPAVLMCEDRVILPIEGRAAVAVPAQTSKIDPPWQRWNDYGIGLFLEGNQGSEKGELIQAEDAFRRVTETNPQNGLVNLARVYFKEGRLAEATDVLQKAAALNPPANWWTVSWLNGLVNKQNGNLDAAIKDFETVVTNGVPDRGFDFSKDYEVLNELGLTLFERAKQERGDARKAERQAFLKRAIARFEQTLTMDSENLVAHYNLALCFQQLAATMGEPLASNADANAPLPSEEALLTMAGEWISRQEAGQGAKLARETERFLEQRRVDRKPTLPILRKLRQVVRGERQKKSSPARPADAGGFTRVQAHLLAILHRNEYEAYQLDHNARDRAIAIYRAKNPAANHAAQSIVIYPLGETYRRELDERLRTATIHPAIPAANETRIGRVD